MTCYWYSTRHSLHNIIPVEVSKLASTDDFVLDVRMGGRRNNVDKENDVLIVDGTPHSF